MDNVLVKAALKYGQKEQEKHNIQMNAIIWKIYWCNKLTNISKYHLEADSNSPNQFIKCRKLGNELHDFNLIE